MSNRGHPRVSRHGERRPQTNATVVPEISLKNLDRLQDFGGHRE
jgi:hypothetical protein